MSYFDDVYLKRLNRYGYDYATRVQGQREREFESYLEKSVYRIDYLLGNKAYPGILEPYKQDKTQTVCYLLTNGSHNMAAGTIVLIEDKDGNYKPWMIWWLEELRASGYNKYTVLKMTYEITWTKKDNTYNQWAYFYGPGSSMIKDTVKSAKSDVMFAQNDNLYMFITPATSNLDKDDYFQMTQSGKSQGFNVTDLDVFSTPGVAYVSIDPFHKKDTTPPPTPTPGEDPADYYWFNGGTT